MAAARRRESRTGTPALPFCHVRLKAHWYPVTYPRVLNNVGDHIRKRRLDLGLQKKQAGKQLGAHATSVANWEAGRTEPDLAHLPKVIDFLGYDWRQEPALVGERLKHEAFQNRHGHLSGGHGDTCGPHHRPLPSSKQNRHDPERGRLSRLRTVQRLQAADDREDLLENRPSYNRSVLPTIHATDAGRPSRPV